MTLDETPNLTAAKINIMGVVNVTPDSFSDGGHFQDPGAAVEHALRLVAAGATIVDVGAESTRPGAQPVDPEEEWRRLAPVLRGLVANNTRASISVDTRHPKTMLRVADAGATLINDVGGARSGEVLAKLARYPGMHYLAMHMRNEPQTMQKHPLTGRLAVQTVDRFFAESRIKLEEAGFSREKLWLDPGFGFGKSDSGNLQMLLAIPRWAENYQIAVGVSRKSLIGRLVGIDLPLDRDVPSKMLEVGLIAAGARLVRTHQVEPLVRVAKLLEEKEVADA